MKKIVDVYPNNLRPIKTVVPEIIHECKKVEMLPGDIVRCICAGAKVIEHVGEEDKQVELDFTNYDKDLSTPKEEEDEDELSTSHHVSVLPAKEEHTQSPKAEPTVPEPKKPSVSVAPEKKNEETQNQGKK